MVTTIEPAEAVAEPAGCCTACRAAAAGGEPSPAWPLAALLSELAGVIGQLTDGDYVRKPVGVIPGSVGGHVRHCLDHVTALLGAAVTGRLDYDHRARGTPVETDRSAALAALRAAEGQLDLLTPDACTRPLRLRVLLTAEGEPVEVGTTVGRELAYVLSHTIHHNAIVGAMVKTLGGTPPERFGYAPSTIRNVIIAPCPSGETVG
jgi:uncharacterized damage-inducible protein DinB